MGGEGIGAEPCHDGRIGQKADAEKDLLGQSAGAQIRQRLQGTLIEADLFDHPEIEKAVVVRQGENTHAAGGYGTDDGGNSRTLNAQFREAEMAVDEQKVDDSVLGIWAMDQMADVAVENAKLSEEERLPGGSDELVSVDKDIDEYADESARNTDIRKSTDRIYDNSGKNCITQLSEGVPDF